MADLISPNSEREMCSRGPSFLRVMAMSFLVKLYGMSQILMVRESFSSRLVVGFILKKVVSLSSMAILHTFCVSSQFPKTAVISGIPTGSSILMCVREGSCRSLFLVKRIFSWVLLPGTNSGRMNALPTLIVLMKFCKLCVS